MAPGFFLRSKLKQDFISFHGVIFKTAELIHRLRVLYLWAQPTVLYNRNDGERHELKHIGSDDWGQSRAGT